MHSVLTTVTRCGTSRILYGAIGLSCRKSLSIPVTRRAICSISCCTRALPKADQHRRIPCTKRTLSAFSEYNTVKVLGSRKDEDAEQTDLDTETTVIFIPKLPDTSDSKECDSPGLADMTALSKFINVDEFPPAKYSDLQTSLAKAGSSTFLYGGVISPRRLLAVGLGVTSDAMTAHTVRSSTAAAVAALRKAEVQSAVFIAPWDPSTNGNNRENPAAWIAHAVPLSDYIFDRHLSKAKMPKRLHHAAVAVRADDCWDHMSSNLAFDGCIAEGTLLARDLANERGDDMNPAHLERIATGMPPQVCDTTRIDGFISTEISLHYHCLGFTSSSQSSTT
eukprot:m.853566 g.853566  ORF g.853566 m.853566 type:complete len:336 (+) comp23500_c0_seq28:182-1189(+)